jgi:hypothetical protein
VDAGKSTMMGRLLHGLGVVRRAAAPPPTDSVDARAARALSGRSTTG